MVIPAGKKVVIKKNSNPINLGSNVDLVLDEDIQLTLSSQFEELVGSAGNQLLNTISGVTRDVANFSFTGQFKQFSLRIWKKTDPISFSFTCTLNMKTNAYTDVVFPAKELMKLCLPTDISKGSNINGIGLVPPGPSILDVFEKGDDRNLQSGNLYSVTIGRMNISPIIIEKVEPIFSRDTDESGYPIWVTLKFDVKTIYTATTNQIEEIFGDFL